jgi:hypothetical protein
MKKFYTCTTPYPQVALRCRHARPSKAYSPPSGAETGNLSITPCMLHNSSPQKTHVDGAHSTRRRPEREIKSGQMKSSTSMGTMGGYTAHKRPDTVGESPSSEIGVLNIPSLKAKKLRKLPREKSTLRILKEVRQQYPGDLCAPFEPLCGAVSAGGGSDRHFCLTRLHTRSILVSMRF